MNVVLSSVYILQGAKSMKIGGRVHELCVEACARAMSLESKGPSRGNFPIGSLSSGVWDDIWMWSNRLVSVRVNTDDGPSSGLECLYLCFEENLSTIGLVRPGQPVEVRRGALIIFGLVYIGIL